MGAKNGARKKKSPGKETAGGAAKPANGTPRRSAAKSAASKGKSSEARGAKTGSGAGRKKEGSSASRPATTAGEAPARKRRGAKLDAKAPARKRRGAKLDAKALASIRAGLVAEKAELLQRQTELDQESFDGSQSEMTGEVGLGEDYADAATATFDRERDLSIRNNIQDLMDQIDRAVERIDGGTYGACERCGQPIEAARLKALHHAVLCLDCKRREERTR